MNKLLLAFYGSVLLFLPADLPFPPPKPVAPPGSEKFLLLLSWLIWGFWLCAIPGIFICAGLMFFYNARGGSEVIMKRLTVALVGCVIGSVAYPIANAMAG